MRLKHFFRDFPFFCCFFAIFLFASSCGVLPKKDIPSQVSSVETLEYVAIPVTGPKLSLVFFDFDKDIFGPRFDSKLKIIVDYLLSNPSHFVHVKGYTDQVGPLTYNFKLGMNRAVKVREKLIKMGAPWKRVFVRSLGSQNLLDRRNLKSDRAKNRRVEFEFFKWVEK